MKLKCMVFIKINDFLYKFYAHISNICISLCTSHDFELMFAI